MTSCMNTVLCKWCFGQNTLNYDYSTSPSFEILNSCIHVCTSCVWGIHVTPWPKSDIQGQRVKIGAVTLIWSGTVGPRKYELSNMNTVPWAGQKLRGKFKVSRLTYRQIYIQAHRRWTDNLLLFIILEPLKGKTIKVSVRKENIYLWNK